jgi:hypothetical protein
MKDPARIWNSTVVLRIMESSALPTDSPYAKRWTSKREWRRSQWLRRLPTELIDPQSLSSWREHP